MKVLKRMAIGIILLLILAALALLYAWQIEPRMLMVRRHEVARADGLGTQQLRIVQLSDLHLGDFYPMERLQKLVDAVNAQQPDVVVFTGDLMDRAKVYHAQAQATALLKQIKAPLGKFAVRGNHDFSGGKGVALDIFAGAGFTFLKNDALEIALPQGGAITVAGLDDGMWGRPDFTVLEPLRRQKQFRVVLMHEPELAQQVPQGAADLMLAGHSHAGQIHIPFLQTAWLPRMTGGYTYGFYTVNGMPLYVSSGLGETGLPVRFCAPPELVVFDVSV